MKIKAMLLAAVVAVAAVAFTGCNTTVKYTEQAVGQSLNMGSLPVKDFVVLGPITVQATEVKETGMFGSSKHTGSGVIDALLMEEVKKLGGHDAINVKISKQEEANIHLWGIFGTKKTYTYTATALAVKYTDTLKAAAQAVDSRTFKGSYGAGAAAALGGFNLMSLFKK